MERATLLTTGGVDGAWSIVAVRFAQDDPTMHAIGRKKMRQVDGTATVPRQKDCG
jgi:hypothetical protein